MRSTSLVTTLLACTALAAETAEAVPVIRRASLPVRLTVADLAQVKTARFWVTADRGTTWQKAHEIEVAEGTTQAPVFTFQVPADGTYGFKTAVVYRSGEAEAEPVNGQTIPGPGELVTIDRTPPAIVAFTVLREGEAVRAEWRVGDTHLDAAPVTLQQQAGEAWTDLAVDLSASGSQPITAAAGSLLRLRVRDQAGNVVESTPAPVPAAPVKEAAPIVTETSVTETQQTVAVPPPTTETTPPVTGEQALAEAIRDLPPADQVDTDEAIVNKTAAPAEAPPAVDAAATTAAKADSPATAPPAEPAVAPKRPVVPPDHQDIVAPNAGTWTPPVVAPDRAPLELVQPAPATHTDQLGPSAESATRPAERARGASAPAQVLANLPRGALLRRDAELALTAARDARHDGDHAVAMALYRRLGDSELAATAILEEIAVYRGLDRMGEATRIAELAPPEAQSDALAVAHARCLLDLGQATRVESIVTRVSPTGAQWREARFLLAQAQLAQGRRREAVAILNTLASGDDQWAEVARRLLAE